MICEENLSINIKEHLRELVGMLLINDLCEIKHQKLDKTVKILELCLSVLEDGTYTDGYEQANKELEDSLYVKYDEGWNDAIEEVKSILDDKGVSISEIERL